MSTLASSTSSPNCVRDPNNNSLSLLKHANVVCIGGGSMASLFAARLALAQQRLNLLPSSNHNQTHNHSNVYSNNTANYNQSLRSTIWMLTSKRPHSEHIRQHGLTYLPLTQQQQTNDNRNDNDNDNDSSMKQNVAHVNVAYSVDEILNSSHFRATKSKIDLVILYIKSIGQNVERAAMQARELLTHNRTNQEHEHDDTGIAITMLNGVGHHDILQAAFAPSSSTSKSIIPLSHVLVGSASQAAILPAAGLVQHTGQSPVSVIANSHTDIQPAQYVADIFNEADIPSHVVPFSKKDSVIWTKLLYNCTINTLGTILQVRNGALQSDIHKALFQRIIKEFLTVTTAAGIELDIERDESMNEAYEDAALRHTYMILDRVAANINSTLSDVLSKRKTENDMLLGTVVKKAKEFNIDVPYIECLYQLIQAKETHYGETLS